MNVGMIRGGTRPNIVPDLAEAEIDIRISPALTAAGGALKLTDPTGGSGSAGSSSRKKRTSLGTRLASWNAFFRDPTSAVMRFSSSSKTSQRRAVSRESVPAISAGRDGRREEIRLGQPGHIIFRRKSPPPDRTTSQDSSVSFALFVFFAVDHFLSRGDR